LLHLPRVVSATEVQLIARNGAQLGLLTMVRAQLDQVNLSVKAQDFYYDNEITRTPGLTCRPRVRLNPTRLAQPRSSIPRSPRS
jgi:hypothetical protein